MDEREAWVVFAAACIKSGCSYEHAAAGAERLLKLYREKFPKAEHDPRPAFAREHEDASPIAEVGEPENNEGDAGAVSERTINALRVSCMPTSQIAEVLDAYDVVCGRLAVLRRQLEAATIAQQDAEKLSRDDLARASELKGKLDRLRGAIIGGAEPKPGEFLFPCTAGIAAELEKMSKAVTEACRQRNEAQATLLEFRSRMINSPPGLIPETGESLVIVRVSRQLGGEIAELRRKLAAALEDAERARKVNVRAAVALSEGEDGGK